MFFIQSFSGGVWKVSITPEELPSLKILNVRNEIEMLYRTNQI